MIILLYNHLFWFPAGQGLKKVILKVDKISNVSEKTSNQNTSLTISFKRTTYLPFILFTVHFRKNLYGFISVMVLT